MSKITQLLCNRFGGIRERNANFSSKLITAQDIQNVELYFTGTNSGVGIRTVKGNVSICNMLVRQAHIVRLFESIQQQKKYFFVYAENNTIGTLYNFNKEKKTLEVLKTNLTPTGKANGFDVAQGWSDLFLFTNGKNMFTVEMNVKNNDNIGTENKIVNMDLKDRDNRSVIGINIAIFNNRLWVSSGNIIWYSVTSNIYDFSTAQSEWITTAGYIECIKNITAIHEYLGSLAVFYEDSSQLISVSNGDFSISEDSPGGCAGYNALVFHDTNLYFYDHTKKSVFSFKQIVTGVKTLGENVAIEIQSILSNIEDRFTDNIQTLSVFMEGRNEIWWIIPNDDEKYSIIMIFDYLKGEWVKRKSQKINSVALIENKLYSAGHDGNILEEYNGSSFNGEYIQHYYKCSNFNLGADNTLKILVFPPRVSFNLPYNNQFFVKYIKNYNIFKKPKVRLIKSKLKNFLYWGIGYWGKNYWASRNISSIGKFPSATFKTLEIEIYTEQEIQSFSIKNIEFSKIKVKQV